MHPPASGSVGQRLPDRVDPRRFDLHVVVDEGDELAGRFGQGTVAGEVETGPGLDDPAGRRSRPPRPKWRGRWARCPRRRRPPRHRPHRGTLDGGQARPRGVRVGRGCTRRRSATAAHPPRRLGRLGLERDRARRPARWRPPPSPRPAGRGRRGRGRRLRARGGRTRPGDRRVAPSRRCLAHRARAPVSAPRRPDRRPQGGTASLPKANGHRRAPVRPAIGPEHRHW